MMASRRRFRRRDFSNAGIGCLHVQPRQTGVARGFARVAVIDADRRVQQSIAEVLRVQGVEVIGTAGDVRSALELVENLNPTVLLVDPRLPDIDAGRALLSGIASAGRRCASC